MENALPLQQVINSKYNNDMKIKELLFAAVAVITIGCSSSEPESETDKEFIIDGVYVPGMCFENTEEHLRINEVNTDIEEVPKLKQLIETHQGLKNRVLSIDESSQNTTVSKSTNTIVTKTIDLVDKTNCIMTTSVDYESSVYDAIEYETIIRFEHNVYALSTPSWTESISVTELVIGANRYELYDYTYFNRAYEIDNLSGRKRLTNDRIETENYIYKIIDNKIAFYDTDGNLAFTATLNLPYLKLNNGDLYRVYMKD